VQGATTTGLVFNLQKYSLQDGPGIRTTVFLKGCPLHCAWCHNPESISPSQEFIILENRCIACGECCRACPHVGLTQGSAPLPRTVEHCDLCGACCDACPTAARELVGRRMTVDELLPLLLRDRVYYDDSGGGVTFSGGEPLLQFEFLAQALAACRSVKLHTAVDTAGLCPTPHLLAIAPLTDLFLFDLKCTDADRHQRYTGAPNDLILQNLQALSRIHSNIWMRIPVIPGVNDTREELDAAARLTASLAGVRQVNLLPYHRSGVRKSERLGKQGFLGGLQPPSAEAMQNAAAVFRSHGLKTISGG
jgi:pyruvate formate lyase activating enzyme